MDLSDPFNHCKHVRTEENPADMGTRGYYSQELIGSWLWWHGPTWLKLYTTLWPPPRTFDPTDLETKKCVLDSTFSFEIELCGFQNKDI